MKNKLRLLLLLICLPLLVAFAPHDDPGAPDSAVNASAAGIGGNGPFNAHNVEILSHVPLSEMGGGPANILANDCWGWTDPDTGREYALCGLMHAVSFVDITNPRAPQYLGRLMTQTGVSTWRDIKVYDNHMFVVSDNNGEHGMQIFDLTELRDVDPQSPQDFVVTAHYAQVGSAHNVAINEETGFAYVVGSNRADGGIHAVNIQNPVAPTEAGQFAGDGYTHDVHVISYSGPDPDYFGREIAFACNTDSLTLVDVTDKQDMVQISRNEYPEVGYTHQCWTTEDQRYVYLGDELDERDFGGATRLIVFDCVDLDNPVFLGFVAGPTNAVDHNLYIQGNKLFLSNYAAGLRIYEIDDSDPLNLIELGYVDTYMADNDTDFDGVWSNYPYFASGNIVVSDRQNGLFVVRMAEIEFDYPNGRPDYVDPGGESEFSVVVTPGVGGVPQAGTGLLHIDRGNGFETFPLGSVADDVYDVIFPEMECGREFSYYISAESNNGTEVRSPATAPSITYQAKSADSISTPFADNFETDLGWTVTGAIKRGRWERGVPQGTGERGDPAVDADGSGGCFLTENRAGNSDVDGGTTILTSPTMDGVGNGLGTTAFLNYHRWFFNAVGNGIAFDTLLVEISNDDGATWQVLEVVGPNGNEVSGGWFDCSFDISDHLTPTAEMRVRFSASDLGAGSIVEAAVDGVEIVLVHCAGNFLLGDVNQDGTVDLLDVEPFVEILSTGGFSAEADMNQDGAVDLEDIEPFVVALSD